MRRAVEAFGQRRDETSVRAPRGRYLLKALLLFALLLSTHVVIQAQASPAGLAPVAAPDERAHGVDARPLKGTAERLVIVKVDGLQPDILDRFVRERDELTGKSRLPWIQHLFYEGGTRVANFYVRGMSLSGPSWSLLDTGQHLQIKGNVEFDRYTLHSYDYLNFIPFWLGHAGKVRVDMPGAELLDEVGLPLLIDAYPYEERFMSFQLYQRGTRWTSLQRGLQNRFTSRSPRELFDEWHTGFEMRSILSEQMERELIEKLSDPRIRYFDFYTTDFDHAAHHNRDRETHLKALTALDVLLGRISSAISKTPHASTTALILVSDHGTNTDERVYSQGYNLVKLLGSAAGGAHHVITKRRLMNDYALKGIYPLIPLIYTTTEESFYLKGQSTLYPTALVDFDGNERASIHLRNSALNTLHILFQQLQRKELAPALRRAAADAFFSTLDANRQGWQRAHDELTTELGALRKLIERQQRLVAAHPKKWTKQDADTGRDQSARREAARLDSWTTDERQYVEYLRTLSNLLGLRRESFDPSRLRVEELFAHGAMGEPNTTGQLQSYVVGLSPAGLALRPDGSLDFQQSFRRVDYFALLSGASVRNNVQTAVSPRPVDFVATRLQPEAVMALDETMRADEVIWLHGGGDSQALILAREGESGKLQLRYLPIARLTADEQGRIRFTRAGWRTGFPLKIWEDAALELPAGVSSREAWLDQWHTDEEWLRAAHRTLYSNAVVGLHEQLARHLTEATDARAEGLSEEERLLRRFRLRQRLLVEADLLILANRHWNFDVRGFNPGGNHGSFFRISTHSTLMLSGGARTGIPHGFSIEEPYDSLSFMPTMLALTGQIDERQTPAPVLWQKGFRPFPGRLIKELFRETRETSPPIAGADLKGDAR